VTWRAQDVTAVLLCAVGFLVPWLTQNLFAYSIVNQILIGVVAACSVFVMLRMNLLTIAVPAFMAIGGYAAALLAFKGVTNLLVMMLVSFVVPALVALPLGALVLRLRGVYFVLVTYVFGEILQLMLFETPAVTGGSNGIAGIPAASLFGIVLMSSRQVLLIAAAVAVLAVLITAAVCQHFRQEFAAIDENEALAQSLGLVVWRYKALGFVVAAGLAGLAGLSLVTMLLTAHPSSFASLSSVNYIAYAIVGGRSSILGPVVGSALLVTASNFFGTKGEYSPGLFGLLIVLVITVARGGIVGTLAAVVRRGGAPAPAATRSESEQHGRA
jgi:branched-chain amino acid transport system permease protein